MGNKKTDIKGKILILLVISIALLSGCKENQEQEKITDLKSETIEIVEKSSYKTENLWKDIENEEILVQKELVIRSVSDNYLIPWELKKEDSITLESMGSRIKEALSYDRGDSIWVFTGGESVAPGFKDIGSKRNYISHFEEFIRWELASDESDGAKNARQRYTINVGKKGDKLRDIVENWEDVISCNNPKVIAHFLGQEDYMLGEEGLDEFSENLKLFLDLGLTESEGKCIVVLQLPYYTGMDKYDYNIEKYIKEISRVLEDPLNGYISDHNKYERILIVNHYDTMKLQSRNGNLVHDGKLTAEGHFEIGNQLAMAITNKAVYYPSKNTGNLFETEIVKRKRQLVEEEYEVDYNSGSLRISPGHNMIEKYGDVYYYEVKLIEENKSEVLVKNYVRLGENDSFQIDGVKENCYWFLQMETSDRNIKFFSKEGIAKKGTVGERHRPVAFTAEATKEQKKIARLLDTKESVRWLFVGDSITHGNIVTHGYDSTVQLFEKYIREELGRPKDIIINSSIWASTIGDYIIGEYAHVRLDWNADVVMVMLGTNDAGMSATREENVFKENYYNLLKKIKEYNPNAIIVIRTPIYTEEEYRETNLLPILSWMKEISFNEDRLTDMYIDQYIPTTRILRGFPWLYDEGRGNDLIYKDDLHPNELGHLILFKQLLNELGLCNADSAMLDFYYDKIKYFTEIREEELEEYINFDKAFINEERNNDNSFKESEVSNLEVTMDVSAFVEDYPQMGNVTLTVINTMTGERREKTANRMVKIGENFDDVTVEWETDTKLTISDLNLNGKYEIEVSGWSVDENKFYSFINSKSKD